MQERHNLSFKKLVITMKCGANVQDQIDISARLLYLTLIEEFIAACIGMNIFDENGE